MSAQKPTAEHMSAAALAPAAAEVAEGLLRQALRTLYKQHYGVPSVTCALTSRLICSHLCLHSIIYDTQAWGISVR